MTDQPNVAGIPGALIDQVRARWDRLPIHAQAFAEYARERGIALGTLSNEIGAELYLAFACFSQLPGAIQTFHQCYFGKVRAIGRTFGSSESFADDIVQRVSERLFVAQSPHLPVIGQYRGDAPLSAWLNTVARRVALREAKSAHPERFLDEDVLANEISDACDQELMLLRSQHREVVRVALVSALREMPKREQRFLQLNLIAGISMDRIGKIYGISQSSVSRKIQRAIHNVIRAAKNEIRAKLKISSEEIESVFRLIQSCIDLTFTQFGEPGPAAAPHWVAADASQELPRPDAVR